MATNMQVRDVTRLLGTLAVAVGVGLGVVGCGEHSTTSPASSGPGESASVQSPAAATVIDGRALAVEWLNLKMPCDNPGPLDPTGSESVVAQLGDRLPSLESVAKRLSTVNAKGDKAFVTGRLQNLEAARLQARYYTVDRAQRYGVDAPRVQNPLDDFNNMMNNTIEELRSGVDSGKTLADFGFDMEQTCHV